MPAPIMPAPSTATLVASHGSWPSGRDEPFWMAWRSKKKACVMFLDCGEWQTSDAKPRDSSRVAVSKGTCAPS